MLKLFFNFNALNTQLQQAESTITSRLNQAIKPLQIQLRAHTALSAIAEVGTALKNIGQTTARIDVAVNGVPVAISQVKAVKTAMDSVAKSANSASREMRADGATITKQIEATTVAVQRLGQGFQLLSPAIQEATAKAGLASSWTPLIAQANAYKKAIVEAEAAQIKLTQTNRLAAVGITPNSIIGRGVLNLPTAQIEKATTESIKLAEQWVKLRIEAQALGIDAMKIFPMTGTGVEFARRSAEMLTAAIEKESAIRKQIAAQDAEAAQASAAAQSRVVNDYVAQENRRTAAVQAATKQRQAALTAEINQAVTDAKLYQQAFAQMERMALSWSATQRMANATAMSQRLTAVGTAAQNPAYYTSPAMQALQQNAANLPKFQQMLGLAQRLSATQASLATNTNAAAAAQNNINAAQQQGQRAAMGYNNSLLSVINTIRRFVVGYIAVRGIIFIFQQLKESIIDFNATIQASSISLTQMLGNNKKAADDLIEHLSKFAILTPFRFKELAELTPRLYVAGVAVKDIIPTIQALGDASYGLHKGAEGVESLTNAMVRMAARGRISGLELNSFSRIGVPALKYLAQAYGDILPKDIQKAMMAMREMISKGYIPAKEAIEAIRVGIERDPLFRGQMEKAAKSFTVALSNVADGLNRVLGKAGKSGFDALNEAALKFSAILLSPSFQRFADDIGQRIWKMLILIGQGIKFAAQYWPALIGPRILIGITTMTFAMNKWLIVLTALMIAYQQFPQVRDVFTNVIGSMLVGIKAISVALYKSLGEITAFLQKTPDVLLATLPSGLEMLMLKRTLGDQQGIEHEVENYWDTLIANFVQGKDKFDAAVDTSGTGTGMFGMDWKKFYAEGMAEAKKMLSQMPDALDFGLGNLLDPKGKGKAGEQNAKKLWQALLEAQKKFFEEIKKHWEKFGSTVDSLIDKVREFGERTEEATLIAKGFGEGVSTEAGNAAKSLARVVDQMKAIVGFRDKIIDVVRPLEEKLVKGQSRYLAQFYEQLDYIEERLDIPGQLRGLAEKGESFYGKAREIMQMEVHTLNVQTANIQSQQTQSQMRTDTSPYGAGQASRGGYYGPVHPDSGVGLPAPLPRVPTVAQSNLPPHWGQFDRGGSVRDRIGPNMPSPIMRPAVPSASAIPPISPAELQAARQKYLDSTGSKRPTYYGVSDYDKAFAEYNPKLLQSIPALTAFNENVVETLQRISTNEWVKRVMEYAQSRGLDVQTTMDWAQAGAFAQAKLADLDALDRAVGELIKTNQESAGAQQSEMQATLQAMAAVKDYSKAQEQANDVREREKAFYDFKQSAGYKSMLEYDRQHGAAMAQQELANFTQWYDLKKEQDGFYEDWLDSMKKAQQAIEDDSKALDKLIDLTTDAELTTDKLNKALRETPNLWRVPSAILNTLNRTATGNAFADVIKPYGEENASGSKKIGEAYAGLKLTGDLPGEQEILNLMRVGEQLEYNATAAETVGNNAKNAGVWTNQLGETIQDLADNAKNAAIQMGELLSAVAMQAIGKASAAMRGSGIGDMMGTLLGKAKSDEQRKADILAELPDRAAAALVLVAKLA